MTCSLEIVSKKYQTREEGKTWKQIRRILMKGKIINKMGWQALQKKFKKAWKEAWEKINKKPPLFLELHPRQSHSLLLVSVDNLKILSPFKINTLL